MRWWGISLRRGRFTGSWLITGGGCSPMRCSLICSGRVGAGITAEITYVDAGFNVVGMGPLGGGGENG